MKSVISLFVFFSILSASVVYAGAPAPLVITSEKKDPADRAKDVRDQLEKVLSSGELNVEHFTLSTSETLSVDGATIFQRSGTGNGNNARVLIIFPDDADVEERFKRMDALEHDPTVIGFEQIPYQQDETKQPLFIIVRWYVNPKNMTT